MDDQLPELFEDELPRLSVKEIRNETLKFFNLEKGLAYTYVSLIRHPFDTVHNYLRFNRKKASNPLQYVLFGVAVYMLILQFHPSFKAFLAKLYAGRQMAAAQQNSAFFEALKKAQGFFFSY